MSSDMILVLLLIFKFPQRSDKVWIWWSNWEQTTKVFIRLEFTTYAGVHGSLNSLFIKTVSCGIRLSLANFIITNGGNKQVAIY